MIQVDSFGYLDVNDFNKQEIATWKLKMAMSKHALNGHDKHALHGHVKHALHGHDKHALHGHGHVKHALNG
jgi:hypothetical protein